MMNVEWSCLEYHVINDGCYVKVFTRMHTHERMNEANGNFMNVDLLKRFLNRTVMNEWMGCSDEYSLLVEV